MRIDTRLSTALLVLMTICGSRVAAQVTAADQLCAVDADPCVVKTTITVADGAIFDLGTRALTITDTGKLNVGAGSLTINSRSLNVATNGRITARGTAASAGGAIAVHTLGDAVIAGAFDVSGTPAGSVSLSAGGRIVLSGRLAINADALRGDSSGGNVDLQGSTLSIDGPISAAGGALDAGGSVTLSATRRIGISNDIGVSGGLLGSGQISIHSGGDIELVAGGTLRANASGGGSAQSIGVVAGDPQLGRQGGSLTLAGSISASGANAVDGGGNGGAVALSGSLDCSVSSKITAVSGQPDAAGGNVTISCGSRADNIVSVSGEIDVSGSGSESDAGSVQITATGAVSISGKLLARGGTDGSGGNLIVASGADASIASTAAFRVGGSGSGSAGSISVDAGAALFVAGTFTADGGSNLEGGGDGGSIDFDADGSCVINADLSATSGSDDASGGRVGIGCGASSINAGHIDGTIDVGGVGNGSSGGSITISGYGSLAIPGALFAKGGPNGSAGDVALSAGTDLDLSGTIRVDASGQASAGSLAIDTDGALSLSGTISAVGGSDPNGAGDGGSVQINVGAGCQLRGQIFTTSGLPDGTGGSVNVTCSERVDDPATITGIVDVRGQGAGAAAGSISIASDDVITVAGALDARGGLRGGGSVEIEGGAVGIAGAILVGAAGGPAGSVAVRSSLDSIRIEPTATFAADAEDGNPGGDVVLQGCVVSVFNGSRATALGHSGSINLVGVNRLEVAGALAADPDSGLIFLASRDAEPIVSLTARIRPLPRVQRLDPNLSGCGGLRPTPTRSALPTATSNRTPSAMVSPTGAATPTSTLRPSPSTTATATATPVRTATPGLAGPGDANCDNRIDAADPPALATALFELEPAQQCPFADANGDGEVSAADLPATVDRVASPIHPR
jgi:hypothetical protein